MKTIVTLPFLPLAVLALFAWHAAPAQAAEPIQLVRPGDRTMACEALAAEINTLARVEAAPDAPVEAAPRKKHFGGLLKVLGSAAPFIPGVGVAGSLVTAAAGAAQSEAGHSSMDDLANQSRQLMTRAMSGPSIADQRKDRLTAIFEEKHC